jgi:hypothetical protein
MVHPVCSLTYEDVLASYRGEFPRGKLLPLTKVLNQLRPSKVIPDGIGLVLVTRFGLLDVPHEQLDELLDVYRISKHTVFYRVRIETLISRMKQIPDPVVIHHIRQVGDEGGLVTSPEAVTHLGATDAERLLTPDGPVGHSVTLDKVG